MPALTDSPASTRDRAAAALAEVYPAPSRPTPTPVAAVVLPAEAGAVLATFVGDRSADLALVVADPAELAEAAGSELVSLPDVLAPALNAAAATIGTGLLGEVSSGDPAGVFGDPEAAVYELRVRNRVVGWFAVRLREEPAPVAVVGDIDERLARINDVEMALTVEIGRTRMSVREVLSLTPGAVIELDRSVGAPADVLLNGRLIARGEIVVVDQDFAIRITRILDAAEASR
jgi:flagellar motor switch protein FliN/FliY